MGKPSMFSNNYHQQVKRRKLNRFLFILLLLCIAFFGGKYYLNKQNIHPFKAVTNINIIKNIKIGSWWDKFISNFEAKKKGTPEVSVTNQVASKPITTSQAVVVPPKTEQIIKGSYIYTDKNNNKYNVNYEKSSKGIIITGLNEATKTTEYAISSDKSKIVFDIKSTSSLVLCDNTGKFKDITRTFYKTRSTGRIISKDEAIASHSGYIWAEKPSFTLDGRVLYLSRLPFIRNDQTLYLWSENMDGTNFKNLFKVGSDKAAVVFGGYDAKGRSIIIIRGINYYLDKGSYMLASK